MINRHPVSPLPFVCMPDPLGAAGGGEDLDLVDENVHADDACDVKQPVGKKPGVMPLPSPKPMSEAEWDEHGANGHLPFHEGCPFCICGRRPNSHHRRSRSSLTIPSLAADYGFLKAHGEDACTFLGALPRPKKI